MEEILHQLLTVGKDNYETLKIHGIITNCLISSMHCITKMDMRASTIGIWARTIPGFILGDHEEVMVTVPYVNVYVYVYVYVYIYIYTYTYIYMYT